MGKTARNKGHQFERDIVNELKELGFDCSTSRYSSKEMDDKCVDIVGTPPFHIQCKAWKSAPNLHTELKKMPDDGNYNVIFHKRPRKGTIVAMTKEDFYCIIEMLKNEKII
jgi:hypothetical protein